MLSAHSPLLEQLLSRIGVCRSTPCCAGRQGIFLGKTDAHYAILANSGDQLDIYAMPNPVAPGSKASKKLDAPPKPMRSLNLAMPSSIFAGPSWGSLPKCVVQPWCFVSKMPARIWKLPKHLAGAQMPQRHDIIAHQGLAWQIESANVLM